MLILVTLPPIRAGCSTPVGPTRHAIEKAPSQASITGMRVIEVTESIARTVNMQMLEGNFAANLSGASPGRSRSFEGGSPLS